MVYWNLVYFKQLYDQYTRSGTSVRTFCQSRSIKENRFYYWIHKLKLNAIPVSKAPKEFIPLAPQEVQGLTGVSLQTKRGETLFRKSENLKLTYPNGVVIEFREGFDMEMLKQLITLIP